MKVDQVEIAASFRVRTRKSIRNMEGFHEVLDSLCYTSQGFPRKKGEVGVRSAGYLRGMHYAELLVPDKGSEVNME